MPSHAHRHAVPELIAQLEANHASNGQDYDQATPSPGLNLAFTRLDSHLDAIFAVADLIRCHHNTESNGEPSLTQYHAGGLHTALCELSYNAIGLMATIHETLTQEKAK